jgi:hypothetical protein
LAQAQPDKPFAGAYRVVPVLAEAVGQTGQPVAVVAEADQETLNRIAGVLRDLGYKTAAGPTLGMALDEARGSAALDLIVIGSKGQPDQIPQLGQTDYRLAAAPVVVTAAAEVLPGVQADLRRQNLSYVVLADNADAAALKKAVDQATSSSSLAPVTAEAASQYALTAIGLLGDIGLNRASIYNVHDAVPALAAALSNPNKAVVTAAGNVLGTLNDKPAQQALATAALADQKDAAVTESLLLALASSARQTGDALEPGQVDQLMKLVTASDSKPVRTAAAAALGALNLPSNRASQLILEQTK